MNKPKLKEDKFNQELEGLSRRSGQNEIDFWKAELHKRYLKKDSLCEIDKLTLTNNKEWMMSRLLNLVIEQELRERITDLTKRVYRLEKALHTGS